MDFGAQKLVLLAEADPLIGLDVAEALETAGYRVAGPLRTAVEVEAWLDRWTPALAVIDVELADRSSAAAAWVLRGRLIPFLVHTALAGHETLPEVFAGAPRLSKPAWTHDVVEVLGHLPQPAPLPC